MNRDDLLDVARENLKMTLYYIQPRGEVLTDASGRQDGDQIAYISRYYYSYLYFAHRDKNPIFSAVCEYIELTLEKNLVKFIPRLLEEKAFQENRISGTKFPLNYFRRFKYSGVFRIRNGNFDLSVIENNPTFLTFIKGSAVLQSMRLGSTFFGARGQFMAEKVITDGDKIILLKSIKHGYFQPFPKEKITGDGIYSKMPREQRELSEPQILNYKIVITFLNKKVGLKINVDGTDNVLVSLEMNFRKGGNLKGVIIDKNRKDSYFLKGDRGSYSFGDNKIVFGPGKNEHSWGTMRGMFKKPEGNTVYINGHTPFKHDLELL